MNGGTPTVRDARRRVVLTGMGVMSPLGCTVDGYWDALVAGKSGVGPITSFDARDYPTRIGAEVLDFEPADYMDRKDVRRMARFAQFAVAAARNAIADAALDLKAVDRSRIGVLLGNGNGGFPVIEEGARRIIDHDGARLDPFFVPKVLPNMAAAHVSLQFGLGGYNNTVVTACAASTQAIGDARDVILAGRADAMVVGGTEAAISELGLAAFSAMRAMSQRNDDPERASRPFDKDRDGFVGAEGAACLVMERLDRAFARGARILAEVVGFASTADAYHMVAPDPEGDGAMRAMAGAVADAGMTPTDIDCINAHGTSTPLNDASETKAIKRVFGEDAYTTPISSTKSMIGHALGASGALEAVSCIQTLRTGLIPPTINYETPDPDCDLDYVPNIARSADVRHILKNSFGFGGQNACLVFKRWDRE